MKGKIKSLGWLLIVIFILSGCGELSEDPNKPPTYSNEQDDLGKSKQDIWNATVSSAQEQVNSKAHKKEDDKKTQVGIKENGSITDEEFYNAVKLFNPNFVQYEAIENNAINQLKIGDKDKYLVTWIDNMGIVSSVVIIFEMRDYELLPIYYKTFGERIESVKYIGTDYLDKPLIEVTSYNASGSNSNQWVHMLMLEKANVTEVWEYQTISNDSHPSDGSGQFEYFYNYNTYLLIPSFQRRFTEKLPAIIVNETIENIYTNKDNVVAARKKKTSEKLFIWDKNTKKFVAKDE